MDHENIIKLLKVIRKKQDLYLIFEYWNQNLYELYKLTENELQENQIKILLRQLLEGISYIHKEGYVHQDLKPENILVQKNLKLKIGDFGSTIKKNLKGRNFKEEYLGTIWYRSPEKLLGIQNYDESVDMWSIGSIVRNFLIFFLNLI